MRFKIYKIHALSDDKEGGLSTSLTSRELRNKFGKLPLYEDKDGSKYTLLYSTYDSKIVLTTLVQSHHIQLKNFKENSKGEEDLPFNTANDKTYLYIDMNESLLYVQNKRYPVDSGLNINKTIDRVQYILSTVFEEYNVEISLEGITISYTMEDFERFFKENTIKYIKASNLEGLELPEGSVLHNPREDLDEAMVESWNYYSKDTVDTIELKAKAEKKLNKNPLAKLALVLARIGKKEKGENIIRKMQILDEGTPVDVKPHGNEYKIVNVSSSQQKEHDIVYKKIIKVMLKK